MIAASLPYLPRRFSSGGQYDRVMYVLRWRWLVTASLVDGAWRVAIRLGFLGRRVIAWFAPLRSANPDEANRIQPTTISRSCVCSTTVQQDTYPTQKCLSCWPIY